LKPLVSLYRNLPKGTLPGDASRLTEGLFVNYRNKHFQNGRETAAPVAHVILLIFGVGYTLAYKSHLCTSRLLPWISTFDAFSFVFCLSCNTF
jgi:F-type H+-transporting ATPase subunit f